MKYLKQFIVISLIALAGEALSWLIPLPVPASIYGIVLLLALLVSGRLRVQDIKETSSFLIQTMQVMFIPAVAGLMESYGLLQDSLLAYAVILVCSTYAVMLVAGRVTQRLIRMEKGEEKDA